MSHPEQKSKYKTFLKIIPKEDKFTTRIICNGQAHKIKLRKYVIWLDILEKKTLRIKAEQPNENLWEELMECVRQMYQDCVYKYFDDRIYEIAKRITHRDLFS